MNFDLMKKAVAAQFVKLQSEALFTVNVDREKIWALYLEGVPAEERQEFTCNSCRSFIRQWGGIVSIAKNGTVSTLWSGSKVAPFKALDSYVRECQIDAPLLTKERVAGTDFNLDKEGARWAHYHLALPPSTWVADSTPVLGVAREACQMLTRALTELKIEATETVLALIDDNALYRGEEFKKNVADFRKVQQEYTKVPADRRPGWLARRSWENSAAMNRIRNSAIGTLLQDLSEGKPLEAAVGAFEAIVAPANYKRPKALVTPRMVEEFKATIQTLGLESALARRQASETDIPASELLFSYQPSAIADIFSEMASNALVDSRKIQAPEVPIQEFLASILPGAKTLEVVPESAHLKNLCALFAPTDPEAGEFLKWKSQISWAYTGGVADAIRDRVAKAGGKVDGVLRVSLAWHNYDDLDLHLETPRDHIYFGNKLGKDGFQLDVDMNAGGNRSMSPVENIILPHGKKLQDGTYTVRVNNFCLRSTTNSGYTVQVEHGGVIEEFTAQQSPRQDKPETVTRFTIKDGEISFTTSGKREVSSTSNWGVATNKYVEVTRLFPSPNHWAGQEVGNKHYIFALKGAAPTEKLAPFYNEYVKEELLVHRRAFEVLGSKVEVAEVAQPLAGLGFSETLPATILVRVDKKRHYRVKIN